MISGTQSGEARIDLSEQAPLTTAEATTPLLQPQLPKKETKWTKLVKEQVKKGTLRGRTCKMYSKNINNTGLEDRKCKCGRYVRLHSYIGVPVEKPQDIQTWGPDCVAKVDVTVYGERKNGARFIRCDPMKSGTMETLIQLFTDNVGGAPRLLISCFGGAKAFIMTDSLEREFMSGIGQLATAKNVWVLTTGLNAGVAKFIGQGIKRHKLLNENASKPTVIGMTSWGTIPEQIRSSLKTETRRNDPSNDESAETLPKNSEDDLDRNHTHFLLLDSGRVVGYIDDSPRTQFVEAACTQTKCYAVTLIVEGGPNTLEVIRNDLKNHRPVVIVAGSGRLSNVLGDILENSNNSTPIGEDEVRRQLKLCHALWDVAENEQQRRIKNIQEVLDPTYRPYLRVFRLGQDTSLTNTIFRAVFDINIRKFSERTQEHSNRTPNEEVSEELQKLLELAVEWNCVDGAHDVFQQIPENERQKYYPILFEQALMADRPLFVDYFLRRYHNPLRTSAFVKNENKGRSNVANSTRNDPDEKAKACARYALNFIIEDLYTNVASTQLSVKNPNGMDDHYSQIIGCYMDSLYRNRTDFQRFKRTFLSFWKSTTPIRFLTRAIAPPSSALIHLGPRITQEGGVRRIPRYIIHKSYGKQEMLRDLFLWSVDAGYVDIAFVLLLRLESRIGAALIAAAMAESLSSEASYAGKQNKYNEYRIAYEEYATECVKACYSHNEQLACQLLLREIPLFGNVTCMQVAIASNIVPFVNTDCFSHVLDQQWSGHLDTAPKNFFFTACKFILSLASFGLLAPLLLDYRLPDDIDHQTKQNEEQTTTQYQQEHRNLKGIEDESGEESTYWPKFRQFHESPIVKMFYEFIVYLWYLMVFSYMMLFHMKSSNEPIHWTEIYVIVTVSAAFIEDIRKTIVEFRTQMVERWHRKSLSILLLYVTPYILFYIGIGLHFASKVQPKLFTPARIVLAIDLELWYIFSLRFVSAIKLLGPKLFMMKNMMRYLVAAMYIILVCTVAYGVVSRALTMYSSLDFTVGSLFHDVFSRPYWFLYSVVEDERLFLDKIMGSETSSSEQIAEATATLILLFFHMLFINVLILNLLIAVFNFAINDIQEKNQYYWHYQRYELIREYYEKPRFGFAPVSLFVYILMFYRFIYYRRVIPHVFKMLATPELDKGWTDFENAATYKYARDFVEEKYRSHPKVHASSQRSVNQAEKNTLLQAQVDALDDKLIQMQKNMNEMQTYSREMMADMKLIMKTMSGDKIPPEQTASS